MKVDSSRRKKVGNGDAEEGYQGTEYKIIFKEQKMPKLQISFNTSFYLQKVNK